ncbi:MAG TPA: hypothetical protein PKE26_08075 [Kiritimatiellia bacterium]|nr:hypothetical protein [Kiritimatiellia bacterium]HMO99050.1 hypothetical protein [Kiritimatiellia bacterium]HMP97614.1 hypothetical protein [Kiritimatiellia bacterium]
MTPQVDSSSPGSSLRFRYRPHRGSIRTAFYFGWLIGLAPLALAQFSIPWSTVDGGGGTSTGGVFRMSGTMGQHDAVEKLTGGGFSLAGGFWVLPIAVQTPGAPELLIAPAASGFATISWSPDTGTNWVLQQSLHLTSGVWSNAPSGWTNPVMVPATPPVTFYRLFRP